MTSRIKLLFIGPPSKTTISNQLLLLSNCLPISGNFTEDLIDAFLYLSQCEAADFPDVIILDEQIGKKATKRFFEDYRSCYYINRIDTLIYIALDSSTKKNTTDKSPLLTGFLNKPLNKAIFLEEIYPMISFTMI